MFLLQVRSDLRPTEDLERVLKSIRNLFDIEHYDVIDSSPYKEIVCESRKIESLLKFHQILRQDRILDTARKVMLSSMMGNRISLKLHKQSAYAGHVSFVTYDSESPLGPIRVVIVSDNLEKIVDWLAPKTSKGRPLWEYSIPKV